VGTSIGSTKLDLCSSKQEAIQLFTAKCVHGTCPSHGADRVRRYLKQTGNRWDERHNFRKQPGRFMPIERDYGDDDAVRCPRTLLCTAATHAVTGAGGSSSERREEHAGDARV
jgi:hypothetical protein